MLCTKPLGNARKLLASMSNLMRMTQCCISAHLHVGVYC